MIHYDSEKFKQHGTIVNRNKDASGRPRSIRTLKIVSALKKPLRNSCRWKWIGISVVFLSFFKFI